MDLVWKIQLSLWRGLPVDWWAHANQSCVLLTVFISSFCSTSVFFSHLFPCWTMVFCIHLASLGKTKNTKSWKEKAQICTFAWTCLITVLHLHSLASGHSLITLKLFLFFRWKCLSPYEEAFLPLSPVFWFCLPLPLLNNNMLNPASSPAWCRCGVFFFFFFTRRGFSCRLERCIFHCWFGTGRSHWEAKASGLEQTLDDPLFILTFRMLSEG